MDAHVELMSREHSSDRHLCVCVDDFGLTDGINEGAVLLALQGRVQALSVLVGGRACQRGARMLQALDARRVEVGLHLDFTECPLQPSMRKPLPWLIGAACTRTLDALAVRREVTAQFDAFEQTLGRTPDYVDGHQHVHQLPVIRDALMQELAHRRLLGRVWLRSTRSAPRSAHAEEASRWKAGVIETLGAGGLAKLAARHHVALSERLLGVYGWTPDPMDYRKRLMRWLHEAREGDVLMCHAGLPCRSSDATVHDPIAPARESEFSILNTGDFDDLVRRAGCGLRTMREMIAARASQH